MKVTALLDGDIIAYRAASACTRVEVGWDDTPTDAEATFDPHEVAKAALALADNWTERTGASSRLVLLTGSANFRKAVDPTYKMNRKPGTKPLALPCARAALREAFTTHQVEGLEADDLIGLALTGSFSDGRGVAVSIDKDMATIPGLHLNPAKDIQIREVSLVEADRYWMAQTIIGDATDGYGGAPRAGPAKAEKALAGLTSLEGLWQAVLAVYAGCKSTPEHALRTARLARILRRGDYDKSTQEVILWTPSRSTAPTRVALSSLAATSPSVSIPPISTTA